MESWGRCKATQLTSFGDRRANEGAQQIPRATSNAKEQSLRGQCKILAMKKLQHVAAITKPTYQIIRWQLTRIRDSVENARLRKEQTLNRVVWPPC